MTEQNPVSNDTSARTWTPSILWSFDTPVIAVSAYQSGDISLAKAAELLGMPWRCGQVRQAGNSA